jgi:hypothetical protein
MSKTITVEHNGKTYEGQIGTIRSTSPGYEDHGILTVNLDVLFPTGGVGVGGYCLDMNDKGERVGTAYGLDHIIRILETAGVSRWEKLPGTQIIVLFADHAGWGGRSVGFASTTDDKVLILEEHAVAWKTREGLA